MRYSYLAVALAAALGTTAAFDAAAAIVPGLGAGEAHIDRALSLSLGRPLPVGE